MHTDRLGEMLRGLPVERAPAGFAGRVLAGLDARPARTGRGLALGLVLAGTLAAAAAGAFAWLGGTAEDRRRSALREAVAGLRSEARELEQALARPAPDPPPLVYLGGDERADYVLDLRRLEAAGGLLPVPPATRGQGGVL